MTGPIKRCLFAIAASDGGLVYFANFHPVKRRGELIVMNSRETLNKPVS